MVQFDDCKLTLQSIAKGTSTVYQTFAPVDTNGAFDTARVVTSANANTNDVNCNNGVVEFGMVAFDWATGALPSPSTNSSMSPVATLTFMVKATATGGTSALSFVNNGITATTDSNIVTIPTTPAGANPEDILAPAPYANSTVNVTIQATTNPSPTPTPTATPVATPNPSPTPSASPSPSSSPTSCLYDFFPVSGGDGKINTFDIQMVGNRWNTSTGNANYDVLYDIFPTSGPNGIINTFDIQLVGNRWGIVCTP
jgi:hypothetical protein